MKEKLQIALDALWEEHGNGYGTQWERLIAELQVAIEILEANDQGQARLKYIIDLFDDKVNPNHYEGYHLKLVEDARAELEELASKLTERDTIIKEALEELRDGESGHAEKTLLRFFNQNSKDHLPSRSGG